MSATATTFDRIRDELLSWPGIKTGPGRFGSVTFSFGTREVGHIHGNSHADLPFPTRIRHEMVAAGEAEPHHFLPSSGWVTVPLTGPDAQARVLAAFARNYDLIVRKKQPAEPMPEG